MGDIMGPDFDLGDRTADLYSVQRVGGDNDAAGRPCDVERQHFRSLYQCESDDANSYSGGSDDNPVGRHAAL